MSITVAKTAGFCFGVNRAVETVKKLADKKIPSCTLGPIIHNKNVVLEFSDNDVPKGSTVVIRSHGVGDDVYKKIEELNIRYVDATCPFVTAIHDIVKNVPSSGYILIAGDRSHPEVLGIIGHCNASCFVFKSEEELREILKNEQICRQNNLIMVAQTTFHEEKWDKYKTIINSLCTNAVIFDTICSATSKRQCEATELSKVNDLMIVVGDRKSSNTNKLYEICSEHSETILVEQADELLNVSLADVKNVGITAGASTPARIIEEAYRTMSDLINEVAQDDVKLDAAQQTIEQQESDEMMDDVDFEQALEDSL